MAAQESYIAARVEPELAEAFSLAAELQGLTVSAALRACMREFVAAAVAHNDGGRATAAMDSAPAAGSTTPIERGLDVPG